MHLSPLQQGLGYFWELSSSGRCSRYGSGTGTPPRVRVSWFPAPQPSEHPSVLASTSPSARCQCWEHSRGPWDQSHPLPAPAWPGWWHHCPPSPVTGSEGLWWPLCQPWCRDPERRADRHIVSHWHGANVAGVTLQRHPQWGRVPPAQHSWPLSLLLEQRDPRGQWLPSPRGPALLTEVTSAVSGVPAWALVVSLLPGVPPSTCQGKGNQ